jgi:starch synthase
MDILFAATELAPYAKVGGLADVTAALSKTLRQQGHNVTLALPRFPHFERAGLLVARRLTPLPFELGGTPYEATLYDGRLPSGVDISLLDVPGLFDRPGIYGDGGDDYDDNPIRFSVFSRAVVELLRQRASTGNAFNIAHVHDWPTALVPLHAKRLGNADFDEQTKYVLTIHNLAYQGIVDASLLPRLGIGDDLFHPDGVEFYGKVNILKAGLTFAEAVTTVSETYAREITKPEQGRGLEGVIAGLGDKLTGIVNGIDTAVWNPAADPALASRFHAEDLASKLRCKTALLQELGLDLAAERPVAAFVGRLVEQKGIDLLLDALPNLMRADVAFIVAGDGKDGVARLLQAAAEKWPGRFVFSRAAPEPLVHRIFAGSDIVLVPSRFEPCGVVQRYAQRYGAVPVVHATGGLLDTVVDCDAALETGTGFVFDEASPRGLVSAMQRALAAFSSKRWPALRRRVMHLDLGWERSARRYHQIYSSLVR